MRSISKYIVVLCWVLILGNVTAFAQVGGGDLVEEVVKLFYESGAVKTETTMFNGKKNGPTKEYLEDGTLISEINYKDNVPTGNYFVLDVTTGISEYGKYLNGLRNGEVKQMLGDELQSIYTYTGGRKNGKFRKWTHISGSRFMELQIGDMRQDKEDGLIKIYRGEDTTDMAWIGKKFYKAGEVNGYTVMIKDSTVTTSWYVKGVQQGIEKRFVFSKGRNIDLNTIQANDTSGTNNLATQVGYKNGLMEGQQVIFFRGRVVVRTDMVAGREQGKRYEYGADSSIYNMYTMENGNKSGPAERHGRVTPDYEFVFTSKGDSLLLALTKVEEDKKEFWTEKLNYTNSNMVGEYQLMRSGMVLVKGFFVDNQLSQLWVVNYPITDSKTQKTYYIQYDKGVAAGEYEVKQEGVTIVKGQYGEGVMVGKWSYFNNKGLLLKEENYKSGKKDGYVVYKKADGNHLVTHVYVGGIWGAATMTPDVAAIKQMTMQRLPSTSPQYWNLKLVTTYADSIQACDWIVQASYFGNDMERFASYLDTVVRKYGNTMKLGGGIPNGDYYVVRTNGDTLNKGTFLNGKKHGAWSTVIADQGVTWRAKYDAGVWLSDYFIDFPVEKGKESPFKGTVTFKHANGKPMMEVRVRRGLRQGKTRFYTEAGVETASENYDRGVLKGK